MILPNSIFRLLSFSRSLLLSGALVAALAVTFAAYVWSEKQIDRANEQRLASYLLADELRQSSDDLTRMVRSYVATGNPVYVQYFNDILDIRSGRKPRPQNYHRIYWDFVTSKMGPPPSNGGQSIALIDLMKAAGFTEEEFRKFAESHAKSDRLTAIEFEAMKLVRTAAPHDEASRAKARELVFGEEYREAKAHIMKPLNDFFTMMEHRTETQVRYLETASTRIRYVFIVLGLSLLFMLWHTYRQMCSTLGGTLDEVNRQVEKLGRGDFSSDIQPTSTQTESVMAWVAEARSRLQAAEDERKSNQETQRVASRVFDTASEGIMFTDMNGRILDVNDAFTAMSGYTRAEVIGKTPQILRSDHHDAGFYADMWKSIQRDGHWRGEVWNRKKSGELYAGILSISRVLDDQQQPVRYISMFTDITPLKQHQQNIERMAYHDTLTQLPNRALLADRMQQGLARARRFDESTAIVCLDLDGFKVVNDAFGHDAGDKLLIETAQRLNACVRTGDTVARLGGDEFVLLLCGLSSREDCERTLRRVLSELMIPFNLGEGKQSSISGSIGYTLYPDDDADPDTLLRHADHAMYAAKQAGKNRYHQFDLKQNNRTKANWSALARIQKALDNGEFQLYIQPKIYLDSGNVAGAEALIRWMHPIRGVMPPAEFLPLIEDQELALSVGAWVIEEGMRLLQLWAEQGLAMPLSVNVSARQLREKDFSLRLGAILKKFPQVSPQRLEIEIVESAALDDMQKVSVLIAECRALGVQFSLDDFGTGYSSLTYLKRLSVDTLKIDQTFVRDMLEDENNLAIVRGVIGLAQAFHNHTVAEGVETWQQAACLKALGCEIAQGYAIARPMPAAELPGWMRDFRMPQI